MLKEDLNQQEIKKETLPLGFLEDVLVFEEIDSTNEYIKRNIDSLPKSVLVVSEVQTAGKGSKGRSWSSPPGSGIWMSLLLRPQFSIEKSPMLTLVMAYSVARTLRNMCNLNVEIKWPNDIVFNGRKICGILTELRTNTVNDYGVILGIGINVNTEQFPKSLQERATSVYIETGRNIRRSELICGVIKAFCEDYNKFVMKGDLSELISAYSEMSATIGKNVRVMDAKGEYAAKALAVDNDGCLLIELQNGSRKKIVGDEVSVRGIYGYV